MPMFTAALFTTAKMWKQPKCPSIDKKINKNIQWINLQWNCVQS